MNKTNSFVKYLKLINNSINSHLEKNLNRLKLDNLKNLARSNKIILTFVALFVLFIAYLLIPTFYNQSDLSEKLKSSLIEEFNLEINFSKKINYNFLPRPHFKINNSSIFFGKDEISKVQEMRIYIKLENLFSLNNIDIKDLIIENANFNFKKENYNFFIKLLENNFINRTLNIKDSNIFLKSFENEVLFINKIRNMKYYYDSKDLNNVIYSKNEIFNIPYEIKIFNEKKRKGTFSELDISFLKLKIENQTFYVNETYNGKANLTFNKLKSTFEYKTNKNFFEFKFFDKLENLKFEYNGLFSFKPFYSFINGKTNKLNLSYLFDTNAIISQLIKTEIFNNENIDFKLNIDAESILNNPKFKSIKLKSKIQEGLIDIDKTKFIWNDSAKFNLENSLIFVREGELVLDGKLSIDIIDHNEIYKFLLTPKNYRNKINKLEFNFTYNFDQKSANLKDIKIDGKINPKTNQILNNLIFKKDILQNRIYLKNIFNEAIKNYAG